MQIFASYRACCYFCHFCFHLRFVYLFIRLPSSHRDLGPANGFCFRSCLALHNAAKKIITPKKRQENEKKNAGRTNRALPLRASTLPAALFLTLRFIHKTMRCGTKLAHLRRIPDEPQEAQQVCAELLKLSL